MTTVPSDHVSYAGELAGYSLSREAGGVAADPLLHSPRFLLMAFVRTCPGR